MAFTRYQTKQMRKDVDKPVEAFQQVQAHVTLCSEYERHKLKEMRDKKQHYGLLETESPWLKRWTLTKCAVRRMKEVLGRTAGSGTEVGTEVRKWDGSGAEVGRNWGGNGAELGPNRGLGRKWDGSRPEVGRKWGGNGAEVGRKWVGSGWEVGGKWVGSGAEVGRKWDGSGAEVGRKWGGTGAELGPKWGGSGTEVGRRWGGSGAELGRNWGGTRAEPGTGAEVGRELHFHLTSVALPSIATPDGQKDHFHIDCLVVHFSRNL